jgi:hypothetical protein
MVAVVPEDELGVPLLILLIVSRMGSLPAVSGIGITWERAIGE